MVRTPGSGRSTRRKGAAAKPIRRLGAPLRPHAKLVDPAGDVVGGAGLRDREWLMLLGGKVVARTDSPALLLAMLRHTQAVAARSRPLRLEASPALLQAAGEEAALHGHPLEDYLRVLEAERAERDQGPVPEGPH